MDSPLLDDQDSDSEPVEVKSPSEAAIVLEEPSPRLGIIHLLVLTTCVAVVAGVCRFMMDLHAPGEITWTKAVWYAVYVLGNGLTLAGFVLWVSRRWRGWPFPVHPGEFLATVRGIEIAIVLVAELTIAVLDKIDLNGFSMLTAVWMAADVVLVTYTLYRLRCVAGWRLFFTCRLATAIGVLYGLAHFGEYAPVWRAFAITMLMPAGDVVGVLVLGIVAIGEHGCGRRYPWTHWLGVVAFLLGIGLQVCDCVQTTIAHPDSFRWIIESLLRSF